MTKEHSKKPHAKWKRVTLTIVSILLALVLLLFAAVGLYINYLMNRMNRISGDESRLNSAEVEQLLQSDPDLSPIDPSASLPDISDVPFPSAPTVPAEKLKHVCVICRGLTEELGISRPALSLVSLRAIGGNAEIISSLSPKNIGNKLIYIFI
jgi:hypothetical protein